jgi:hypothetical protein
LDRLSDHPHPYDSQKLVRCEVVNRYREGSTRFVALEAFKLWEYLMTEKHGLQVSEPRLCLWLDAATFGEQAALFEHIGEIESVSRVVVDLYDAEYGFSQTLTRYARHGDTDRLVEILRSHVPEPLNDPEACRIEVIEGRVVHKWHPNAQRNILTGLEG